MALGSIPWSSIIKWCHLYGIYDIDSIKTIQRYIRAMEKADYDFDNKKKERAPK